MGWLPSGKKASKKIGLVNYKKVVDKSYLRWYIE